MRRAADAAFAETVQVGMYAARRAAEEQSAYVQEVADDWWLPALLQFVQDTRSAVDQAGISTVAAPWDSSLPLPVWIP